MKKGLITVLVMALVLCFSSCSREESFVYPMEVLYGTWEGIGIFNDEEEEWINISEGFLGDEDFYEDLQFSISFYEDGSYYGRGLFGTGSGTYKAEGKTITTYVNGEVYFIYDIISLNKEIAVLNLRVENGDPEGEMRLKVRKK
ncbi:MAG: hypothetical protein J6U44_05010 [Paludibacteraceae bacterium]|nr:hypothetical protein [Paludibacteraceae bacterium]